MAAGAAATGCISVPGVATQTDAGGQTISSDDGADAVAADGAGQDAGCTLGTAADSGSFQNTVAACVLAASCSPLCLNNSLSMCVTNGLLSSGLFPTCLASITTCTGYEQCIGLVLPATSQCPSGTSTPAACVGGVAINCGADVNAGTLVEECSAWGKACGVYDDGSNGSAAGCIVDTCTDTDGLQHCDANDNVYQCVDGIGYGLPCPSLGRHCALSGGGATCVPDGPTCNLPSTSSCTSATTATLCGNDGIAFDVTCTPTGLVCMPDNTGISACVAPGCTLSDVNDCVETCNADGHTATLCIGGAPYTMDCASYGFAHCSSVGCDYLYCSYE